MSLHTKTTIQSVDSLDAALLDRWRQLQQSNPALDSPFFSPGFTQVVSAERPGVEVAILEAGNTIVGFFPYCRSRRAIAAPTAGSFSDFQGVISAPDLTLDMHGVLREARLVAWQFDHLVAAQESLTPYLWKHAESPYMDLSQGFDAYRESCRPRGGKEMSEVLRKARKLEREVAPVRFECESTDVDVLNTLILWKRQQLSRRHLLDCFRPSWVLPMLNRVLQMRSETFRPMLSALYVGDEIAAINLGLRNGPVLHGWITAFNPAFQKFSPGLMLIIKIAAAAESLGIGRLDMGRGEESFKRTFCSGSRHVGEGAVDRRLVAGTAKHCWVRFKKIVRRTSLAKPAETVMQRLRYASGRLRHSLESGN